MSNPLVLIMLASLVAAAVAVLYAVTTRSKVLTLTDQVTELEGQVRAKENAIGTLQTDLVKAKREVKTVTIREPAPKAEVRTEKAVKQEKRPKTPEKDPREQRVKELEDQLAAALRRGDKLSAQFIERDQDAQKLREQLENLEVEITLLKENRPAVKAEVSPEVLAERAERAAEKAAEKAATPEAAPAVDTAAIATLEAKITELRHDIREANVAKSAAQERANLHDLELHRLRSRVTSLQERSRAIVERMSKAERDGIAWKRDLDNYSKMYEVLKGRYDVARDLLYTFRQKFGVEIPTELGVPLYADMEEYLEYDEEEDRSRPRSNPRSTGSQGGTNNSTGGGRLAAGATATEPAPPAPEGGRLARGATVEEPPAPVEPEAAASSEG